MKRRIRIDNARIQLFRNTEPGLVLPGEFVDSCLLTWMESGQLHCVTDGQDTLLSPGELHISQPGQWQMQYADMDSTPQFVRIALEPGCGDLTPLTGHRISLTAEEAAWMSRAFRELQTPDIYSEDIILSSLEMILLTLLRRHMSMPVIAEESSGETEIIRRAQQAVSTHVREKLTVPMVARMAEVSPSYLTALFQKHLSISPGEYIRRVKLQESKRLIREGRMNFTEIAAALNYSTIHHFSRQFKEKFGISPTEYAASAKSAESDS